MKDLTVNWATPLPAVGGYGGGVPGINTTAFNNVNKAACTLHVPAGTEALYKAADVWGKFNIPGANSVTGVSLNPITATLEADKTQQLTATVSPDDAMNKNVSWSSSNTSVASVSSSGLVTAKAAGKTTITVTTEDGNHKATCNVTVNETTVPPTPTPALSISLSSLEFAGAGGEKSFAITSNTDWTVASDAAWLTVSPASGSDNETVTVTAAANTATTPRTAIITVSATGVEQKIISVTQAETGVTPPAPAPALSISLSSLDFFATGEEKTFAITSNTAWTVGSDAAWLTVSPASGNDNGTVTVTAAVNTATTARTAVVSISGTGVEPKTITVTQAAAGENPPPPPPPTVVPEETQTVGADGNGIISLTLSIPTGATLTGSFEVSFPTGMALDEELTVLSAEFAGNFTLSFTAKANNTWLIEIKSKGLRADVPRNPYRRVMDIAYKASKEVQQGAYEATITNLDFRLSDNTQIEESLLTVPVHVTQTVTSVESIDSTPFTAYFAGDILRVESGKAERINVYSFAGVLLYTADKPEGMIEIPFQSNRGTFCIVRGSRSGVLKVAK